MFSQGQISDPCLNSVSRREAGITLDIAEFPLFDPTQPSHPRVRIGIDLEILLRGEVDMVVCCVRIRIPTYTYLLTSRYTYLYSTYLYSYLQVHANICK